MCDATVFLEIRAREEEEFALSFAELPVLHAKQREAIIRVQLDTRWEHLVVLVIV